jgi:hypothetical protein
VATKNVLAAYIPKPQGLGITATFYKGFYPVSWYVLRFFYTPQGIG